MKPFTVLLVLLMSASVLADTVWLKGASLVDPVARKTEKIDISIVGGKVRRGHAPAKPGPRDRIVDISGRYIIPGIYDMHVHSTFGNPGPGGTRQSFTPQEAADAVLRAGVTGYLDLFADENTIFAARTEQRKTHQGADIFAAGPMFTCPGGHGTDLGSPTRTVSSPKEAETQVAALAKKHPDVIKIAFDHAGEQEAAKPVLTPENLRAIIHAAHRHGFKTIVHIGNWDDAKQAVLAGTDIVTHLYETDIPDDLVKLFQQHHITEIPTMTYQTELLHILENRQFLTSPLLVAMLPLDLMNAYRNINPSDYYVQQTLAWQSRGRDSYPRSLAKLIKGGIPILCGTDSGDLGVFHGFSVHREMVMMVQAGASPWTALASATTLSKKFLSRPSGIRDGDLADLVVIKGDPIQDIANTQNVELVFHHGELVENAVGD